MMMANARRSKRSKRSSRRGNHDHKVFLFTGRRRPRCLSGWRLGRFGGVGRSTRLDCRCFHRSSASDVQRLRAVSSRGAITLVHFIDRHNTRSQDFKDCEFSRATITELWDGGFNDVRLDRESGSASCNRDRGRHASVRFQSLRRPARSLILNGSRHLLTENQIR